MKYLIIYILIGSITLIANIILLVIYLKINYFNMPKKTKIKHPEETHLDNNEQNVTEPFENTEYVYEDENQRNQGN
ncbi:MAG: hypothetical protein BWY74_02056 [Firmicutes bacterium ADurb.Bin419]|nr:MAG: hypothetical protein BWY74_02056 [Firmicutes bacterium ADurb.Bin419]